MNIRHLLAVALVATLLAACTAESKSSTPAVPTTDTPAATTAPSADEAGMPAADVAVPSTETASFTLNVEGMT